VFTAIWKFGRAELSVGTAGEAELAGRDLHVLFADRAGDITDGQTARATFSGSSQTRIE
jgi:hypothetical protein